MSGPGGNKHETQRCLSANEHSEGGGSPRATSALPCRRRLVSGLVSLRHTCIRFPLSITAELHLEINKQVRH